MQPFLSSLFRFPTENSCQGFSMLRRSRQVLNTPAHPHWRNVRLTFVLIARAYDEYNYRPTVSSICPRLLRSHQHHSWMRPSMSPGLIFLSVCANAHR